jgi:two-component system, cell cycle response regulator
MSNTVVRGELVPIADRLRWMTLCRVGLAVVLTVIWISGPPRVSTGSFAGVMAGWLALSTLALLASRTGRRVTIMAFTAGLLADGLVLDAAWWITGDLDGPVGYLVGLHLLAVTLLASFRTGLKMALWYSILALVTLEATAAGMLGPAEGVPVWRLAGYLSVIWIIVLCTASFAAMNERELRRRRYDSEMLRQLGLELTAEQDSRAVALTLACFGHDHFPVLRCAVIVFAAPDADQAEGETFAVVVAADGAPTYRRIEHREPAGLLRWATGDGAPVLASTHSAAQDMLITDLLPDPRNVVIVPFRVGRGVGALVLEHRGRFLRRAAPRVSRRAISTAEQAAVQAAMALGRAILTERLRAAASTDGLTGVGNRRHFDATLTATMARAETDGQPFAITLIDLDHFKRLNDEHGHLVGDEALRAAADAITAASDDRSMVARYGGEEFVVIIQDASAGRAVAVAERIRRAIADVTVPVPVTASIGVAFWPAHGRRPGTLLASADAALYEAKATGRNRVLVAAAPAAAERPEHAAAQEPSAPQHAAG